MKFLLPVFAAAPFLAIAFSHTSEPAKPSEVYFWAIRDNRLDRVRDLVKSNGVHISDELGNSPLMFAALDGTPDCMKLLLDAGAEANEGNKDGAVPLLWCAGDPSKVRLLLEHGAKVNVSSKGGHTPLELAAYYDADGRTVKMLLAAGADAKAADAAGDTALHYAAGSNSLSTAHMLLACGAEVNKADKPGNTPLLIASGNGYCNAAMVRLLLKNGAKPNVVAAEEAGGRTLNGALLIGRYSPLQLAATCSYGATKALIDAGADVNAKDVRGGNALAFAAACDRVDPRVIKLLLAHGCAKDSAIVWAKRYRNPAVLSSLGLTSGGTDGLRPEVFGGRPDTGRMRSAIVSALASCQPPASTFEQKGGGCASCHAQIATGIAVSRAKALGLKADYELEAQQAARTMAIATSGQDDVAQLQDPGGAVHTVANYLLHMKASGASPNLTTDSMVHYICAYQRKEGDFPVASYTRPPFEEGSFNSTAQAIQALRAYPVPALKAEIESHVKRAANWLAQNPPVTTDDRAMQIIGIRAAGGSAPETRVRELIARQRPDGGWGETDQLPSDAYSTAETLIALHKNGLAIDDQVMDRAIQYLLNTQHSDGTWHVVSRSFKFQPYFESGFPYGPDQWISQEGTALAATALAEVLGAP